VSIDINGDLADQLSHDEAFKAGLAELAAQAASAAQGLAPPGMTVEVKNDADGVRVEMSGGGINPAGWVELGTATQPAKAPLRQGCEQAGMTLTGRSR
jgi:hypothetical protein